VIAVHRSVGVRGWIYGKIGHQDSPPAMSIDVLDAAEAPSFSLLQGIKQAGRG
jgi:hypothetical protein